MFLLDVFGSKLFLATTIVVAIVYAYLKYCVYVYWKRHGIPHEAPAIPFGNFTKDYLMGKKSMGELLKENYNKFKRHPFHGFYALYEPVIMANDPELIRTILVKEFPKFCDRGWFIDEKMDPMSGHLFLLEGDKWKGLRGKLSPAFTSGKLKQMYQLFAEVSDEMISACDEELTKSRVLEMKDIIARYTTDIISSVVYGVNCNSLKNPKSEFRRYGLMSLAFGKISLIFAVFIPNILRMMFIPLFNKEVNNFFLNLMNDTMNHRRREKVVRKDFLNLLMQLVDHGEVQDDNYTSSGTASEGKNKLNATEVAAQAFVFFLAGYETASSTATYALYELAKNPDIQKRLQDEIDEVSRNKGINYDSVMNMEYLDMVFYETLRKYPSVPILNRICIEDFKIPNSNFTVPKGMRVCISASGIHNNPKHYPEPEKFDPQRHTKENVTKRDAYISLGFGEGPRHCIGKRFGLMQGKQALVALLQNYTFHVCEKTPIPVEYDPDSFVQSPLTGIYLRLEKRNAAT